MLGLRVTGGSLRGRKLRIDPQAGVRPTSERARQAYFNIVGNRLPGARFLDLYAGSGVFSFEAVSRGAREAIALDLSRRNVASIMNAAREWSAPVRAEAVRLPEGLQRVSGGETFDLVYADPPYNDADYATLLASISESVPLASGALVALEHRSATSSTMPEGTNRLRAWRTNRYGNVSITFFDLSDPSEHE